MLQHQCRKNLNQLSHNEQKILYNCVLEWIILYSNKSKYGSEFDNIREQLDLSIVFIIFQRPACEIKSLITNCCETLDTPPLTRELINIMKLLAEEAHRWRIPCSLQEEKTVAQVKPIIFV